MPEFTVTVETRRNGDALADAVADRVLDYLRREPAALSVGGIGIHPDGRLSTTFQVVAPTVNKAKAVASQAVTTALSRAGAPQRVGNVTARASGPAD